MKTSVRGLFISGFVMWLEENWEMEKVFHFGMICGLVGFLLRMSFLDCFQILLLKRPARRIWVLMVIWYGVGGGGGRYLHEKKKLSIIN